MTERETHPTVTRRSRLYERGSIDGRSRSGRFLSRCRAELRAHLGPSASPAQLVLVDRCAWAQLRLALLDEKAASGVALTVAEERAYGTLNGSVIRTMRALGLKAAPPPPPSLADVLADIAAKRDRAA